MRKTKSYPTMEKSESENGREEERDENEDGKGFYACYLLTSLCPRFKGHTYIGFTVNPRRRIRQHNGELSCGAFRTKKRRPWEMVFCIYGFPTNVSALQFEWAWQHPTESLAVRQATASFKTFSGVANKIKLAYTMLNLPAWESLNITVNYFSTKYAKHSAACPSLPEHMKVQYFSIDELPCYTETGKSLFDCKDAEDVFDGKEEYEYAINTTGTVQANMTEVRVHYMDGFPCDNEDEHLFKGEGHKASKDDGEYSAVSTLSRAMKKTDADTICHIFPDNVHNMEINSSGLFGRFEEYSKYSLQNTAAIHPTTLQVDNSQPFVFINSQVKAVSSIFNSFSMEKTTNEDVFTLMSMSVSELDWLNGKNFASRADTDSRQIHSNTVSHEIEVIDLLSPSPECRTRSSRKKRRVSTVYPEIIDLT